MNTKRTLLRGGIGAVAAGVGLLGVAGEGSAGEGCDHVKLIAADGTSQAALGGAVAVSGEVVVAGAKYGQNEGGTWVGAAYVYRRDGAWVPEQKLVASDGEDFDEFGIAVAASGDVIVVGAQNDGDNGSSAGAAYVYRWSGSAWDEERKLLASDGAPVDLYGSAVALSGDVAIIGSQCDDDRGSNSGSAYVYRWDGDAWNEEQKLVASDGQASDTFGNAVSISGDVAIIAAVGDDDRGSEAGAAYVFRWNGSTWEEVQKLAASDGAPGDAFGFAVSISGDLAIVGAHLNDDNGTNCGSAYVYAWDGKTWSEEQTLMGSGTTQGDLFGAAVAVSGDLLVVGAYRDDDDDATDTGATYTYMWSDGTWNEEQRFVAADADGGDQFGVAVAASGNVAVAGALNDDESGSNAGAAYAFDLGACLCPADLDGSGDVGFADLLRVLDAWGDEGGPEDLDGGGTVDFADLLIVLDAWGQCPLAWP